MLMAGANRLDVRANIDVIKRLVSMEIGSSADSDGKVDNTGAC